MKIVTLLGSCLTDRVRLNQKAYFFKEHYVTFIDEAEWFEPITVGVDLLVNTNKQAILCAFEAYKKNKDINFSNDLYSSSLASYAIIIALWDVK